MMDRLEGRANRGMQYDDLDGWRDGSGWLMDQCIFYMYHERGIKGIKNRLDGPKSHLSLYMVGI